MTTTRVPDLSGVRLPLDRSKRPECGDRSNGGRYWCNRWPGHTGRHMWFSRFISGMVAEVWG